jgi:glycosyltransferase involved in cell wall biosynthesis
MKNESIPLISLVILFYNQEKFVRETLEAAFLQDYANLEIVVSDDNSKDKTFSVIQDVISKFSDKHTHKIKLNKNEQNLGLIEHVNKACIHLATGQFLVMNGGDDISLPTRCSDVYRIFSSEPNVKFIYGSYFSMSESGEFLQEHKWEPSLNDNSLNGIINYEGFHGASCSYHRDVFDFFGPISCSTIEDRTLVFRAMLLGEWVISEHVHIKYRLGGMTASNVSNSSPKKNARSHIEWALKHHLGVYKQLRADISTSSKKLLFPESKVVQLCDRRLHLLKLLDVLNSNKIIQIYHFIKMIVGWKNYQSREEKKLVSFFLQILLPDFLTISLFRLRMILASL